MNNDNISLILNNQYICVFDIGNDEHHNVAQLCLLSH